MTTHKSKIGRLQLYLVGAVFLGPLLLAALMYLSGYGQNRGTGSNHGILLAPVQHLPDHASGASIMALAEGRWLLVYLDDAPCGESCRQSLYRLRQSRLMLANDMERVARVFLHGETPPDKVFLGEQHDGLISTRDDSLALLMNGRKPTDAATGGFYLVDPLGNLVMYFPPELDPGDMVEDLKHLLDLSRIG